MRTPLVRTTPISAEVESSDNGQILLACFPGRSRVNHQDAFPRLVRLRARASPRLGSHQFVYSLEQAMQVQHSPCSLGATSAQTRTGGHPSPCTERRGM